MAQLGIEYKGLVYLVILLLLIPCQIFAVLLIVFSFGCCLFWERRRHVETLVPRVEGFLRNIHERGMPFPPLVLLGTSLLLEAPGMSITLFDAKLFSLVKLLLLVLPA